MMYNLVMWFEEGEDKMVGTYPTSREAAEAVPVVLRAGTWTEEEKASYGYSWGFFIQVTR